MNGGSLFTPGVLLKSTLNVKPYCQGHGEVIVVNLKFLQKVFHERSENLLYQQKKFVNMFVLDTGR
jgi:hypothetical protein